MWQAIKKALYELLVRSHILYYLAPYLMPLFIRFNCKTVRPEDHIEKDDSGQGLRVTQYNGKNYPAVGLDKVKSIPYVRIRENDTLLCSFSKAGCHWLQEILHMMVTGQAKLTQLGKEFSGGFDLLPNVFIDSIPSPRVLNSHLVYEELPCEVKQKKIKIVFLARNPKDIVVSFYNHHMALKEMYSYDGTFADYFKMFMEGRLEYGGYFEYMKDWDQVMKGHSENPIKLVTYEDLKVKPLQVVRELSKYLDLSISDEFAQEILNACQFQKLKDRRSKQDEVSGKMYRKGIVGDWQNWLTEAQSKEIDKRWRDELSDCFYQPQYHVAE